MGDLQLASAFVLGIAVGVGYYIAQYVTALAHNWLNRSQIEREHKERFEQTKALNDQHMKNVERALFAYEKRIMERIEEVKNG